MGTPFTGSGFSVQSVTQLGLAGLRVRFTYDPLTADPAGTHDALNPSNYSVLGPDANLITHAATVPDDPQSVDLTLAAPLVAGTWTLTCSSDIQTATANALQTPRSAELQVELIATTEPVHGGAINDTAEATIRKHFPPSFVGRGWNALIAALGVSDKLNWENARLAFDQLFKITASGFYLDRRAADDGLQRPASIGMPDDLFRQLSIKTSAAKITPQVLLEILEIFYGSDSVRAAATTELTEPFVLADGDDLTLLMDEREPVVVVFAQADFTRISQARAREVAAAITRGLRLHRNRGFAIPVTDPATGKVSVRVYSGSLGLGSSVRVTGGRAQLGLGFPALLSVYSNEIVSGDGYDWTVSSPAPGVTRLQLVLAGGGGKIDLSSVQSGDYVIFEAVESSIPAGVYPIEDVIVSYTGSSLVQSFDIAGSFDDHVFRQLANREITFYTPTRHTIHQADSRTVVVAQTQPSQLDIVLPATTRAVGRDTTTAAYPGTPRILSVASMRRVGTEVLVETASAHGLVAGGQVLIDGAAGGTAGPTIAAGASGSSGGAATSDASIASIWTTTRPHDIEGTTDHVALELPDGRVLLAGGRYTSGSETRVASCQLFRVSASAVLGDGAKRYTYHWDAAAALPSPLAYHAGSVLTDTANSGKVLVTGGIGSSGYSLDSFVYTPDGGAGSWTVGPAMTDRRAGHTSTTLQDGRVLLVGGAEDVDVPLHTSEFYNPESASFSAGPQLLTERQNHRAVLLNDGRVMVIGGESTDLLSSCEIWDPATNTWAGTGRMDYARVGHTATVLPDGRVVVVGGVGFRDASGGSAQPIDRSEIWNPATGSWSPAGRCGVARTGHGAVYLTEKGRLLVAGGQQRAEYFDPATFTWRFAPNPPAAGAADATTLVLLDDDLALLCGRDAGGAAVAAYLYQPGEDVFANGGLTGIFEINAVPSSTTFKYRTPDHEGLTVNETEATVMAFEAEGTDVVPGPFIFDPREGLAIAGVETTATMDLFAGQRYSTLSVQDASQFPDAEGWLVFNFGTSTAVSPVRYLGRLDDSTLTLDYSFKFPISNIKPKVTLLKGKGGFVPKHPEKTGATYLTASSAGRTAAMRALEENIAEGIDLNIRVVYPGDRGLGGEGLPTTGQKISDKVAVWGGDNLTAELAKARGEE